MDATNIDSYLGDLMDHRQSCHLAGCLELTGACQEPQLHLRFAGYHRPSRATLAFQASYCQPKEQSHPQIKSQGF